MFRVLVVDDNHSDIVLIGSILKKNGMLMQAARDPFEAEELLNNSNFDLILLDWQMPKMSGINYLKNLRRSDRHSKRVIPVIMITGRNHTKNIMDAVKEGVSDYILKPINPESFKIKILAFFKRKDAPKNV